MGHLTSVLHTDGPDRSGCHRDLIGPGVTEDGDLKGRRRASGIEELVMDTVQGEIGATRIGDLAAVGAFQCMAIAQLVVHMAGRRGLVGAAVEGHDPAHTAVRISAVGLTMCNIVNTVTNVGVGAAQTVLKMDVQSLGRAIAPGLVVRHACPADIHHGTVAGVWVGLAPSSATETAFGVPVDVAMDAVQAMGAVKPAKVIDLPGRDGTALRGSDGARHERSCFHSSSGRGGGQSQKAGQDGGEHSENDRFSTKVVNGAECASEKRELRWKSMDEMQPERLI